MPQDTFLPEDPPFVGLKTEWEVVDIFAGAVWQLTIKRKRWGGDWETVHASQWSGVMMDMASLLSSDVINAFLYGDGRDVSRAAASVAKVARRHRKTYNGA